MDFVSRRTKLFAGFALGAATLAFTLILLEVSLRLLWPQFGPCDITRSDAEIGSVLRPDHTATCISFGHTVTPVRTNAEGLRNRPVEMPKPPGTFRILVLGDSTTFGTGVAKTETIPAILQDLLAQRIAAGSTVEVINAGVPSYGTAQEWLLYRRLAPEYDPDLVLLLALATNDIQDNLCEPQWSTPCFVFDGKSLHLPTPPARRSQSRKSERRPEAAERAQPNLSPGARRSHLYAFTEGRLPGLMLASPAFASLLRKVAPSLMPGLLPETIVGWYEPRHRSTGWALTEALLDALLADTRRYGARLVAGILPSRPQTTPAYVQLLRVLYPGKSEVAEFQRDPRRPQRLSGAWARSRAVPFVDPLPQLQEAGRTATLNVPDGHFNAIGNAVIASEAARVWGIHLSGLVGPGSSPRTVRGRALQTWLVPTRQGPRGRHRPRSLGGDEVLITAPI